MDATTRWETEALRSGSSKRANPPRPTSKRGSASQSDRTWLTLKEAEAATGIPSNTLRKWVRKEAIDTYLESDGEMALRMVALDSVRERAEELGREIDTTDDRQLTTDNRLGGSQSDPEDHSQEVVAESRKRKAESDPEGHSPEVVAESPPGTMLVPVDAWNKMLDQLGNLHEAGQQLAEARERAAKAETEATFLRERLKEMRESDDRRPTTDDRSGATRADTDPQNAQDDLSSRPPFRGDGRDEVEPGGPASLRAPSDTSGTGAESGTRKGESAAQVHSPEPLPGAPETTTYWRYLTTGWRDRKRRSNS